MLFFHLVTHHSFNDSCAVMQCCEMSHSGSHLLVRQRYEEAGIPDEAPRKFALEEDLEEDMEYRDPEPHLPDHLKTATLRARGYDPVPGVFSYFCIHYSLFLSSL